MIRKVVSANTQESESYDYKRESFRSAKFVGHIKPGMKFNRNGELEMTISVPFEYRDAAQLVSYIFDEPMVIEVQKWDGSKIE